MAVEKNKVDKYINKNVIVYIDDPFSTDKEKANILAVNGVLVENEDYPNDFQLLKDGAMCAMFNLIEVISISSLMFFDYCVNISNVAIDDVHAVIKLKLT